MKGPSVWWSVPFDPIRWFTESEIEASARYHAPIRRAAIGREASRVVALLAAFGFLRMLDSDGVGWTEWMVPAIVTGVAWSLPATAADAWFEYRHEPRFGQQPVEASRFAVVGVAFLAWSVILSGAVGAAAVALLRSPATPLLIGFVVAAVGLLATSVGGRFAASALELRPIHDVVVQARIDDLIADQGRGVVDVVGVAAPTVVTGLTANVSGPRRRRTLTLSEELVASAPEVRDHVVAHELAHLRRRDLGSAWMIGGIIDLLVVTAVAGLVREVSNGSGFAVLGHDIDLMQSSALPALGIIAMASGGIAAIPAAWLSRVHERRADLDAIGMRSPIRTSAEPRNERAGLPVLLDALRHIHVTDRADLAPPRWAKVFSSHPAPGERLELMHRASRNRTL